MQTLKLTHDQFLVIMASNPDLKADSAHYEFFSKFFDMLSLEGQAGYPNDLITKEPNWIALLLVCLMPYKFIEEYDNATDSSDEDDNYEEAYSVTKRLLI